MNISAVIMAFNEEQRILRLFESLKGIDEILLIDHGSTDNTIKLAQSLGARVFERSNHWQTPTQEDINNFKKKYGFNPQFTTESKLNDGGADRNEGAELAKNDWIFNPDCDEIVTWDLTEIGKLLPLCDKIEHRFIHSHNPDGSIQSEHKFSKLYRKSKCKWVGKIHEVVVGDNIRIAYTDKMRLDHWQKPRIYRNTFLASMEYAVLLDNDLRTLFYLAREYYYSKEYEKAIKFFQEYMDKAVWRPEIAFAWLIMAKCCWQIQKGDDARKYCLSAIAVNPDYKEALMCMSEFTGDNQKEHWKRYSEIATNNEVLFKNSG